MRVLVTGSSGFLGQHVVKELEDEYELVTPRSYELDLLLNQCMSSALTNLTVAFEGIDAVVHLAATCGGIGINKENPGRFIYENLQMGINVLEAARLAGVSKVVNLGTVCMYPKYTPVPFREQDIWNGYPEETNAPYGIAKRAIVEMGKAYSRQYGLDVTNLIPVNMAGEYDNFDESSSHVIPALIKKFENPTLVQDENSTKYEYPVVTLWGTGSASREFLNAKDCARAIAIALETNTGPDPINLGTGREITIRELAELIRSIGGYDSEIIWDETKPDGQPRRCLDVSRAKEALRWEAQISLEETIRTTIDWYRYEYNQDT